VAQDVTIWYRGAKYQLGRGPGGYRMSAPDGYLAEWPETPEGWAAAWARFTMAEEPASIVHLSEGAAAGPKVAAASPALPCILLASGVAAGAASLLPGYFSAQSLAHQPAELVPHIIYLVTWAASALLILAGGVSRRVGALLGLGVSAVTFGYFWIDVATAVQDHFAGPGLFLGLAGWLACATGSVLACRMAAPGAPRRPRAADRGALAVLALGVLGAVGTAVALVPSWDSFLVRAATGASQTVLEGYAFTGPALLIAGNVVVMVVFVAAAVAAASWRSHRLGAALLAGATIPMAAQALSARIMIGQTVSPGQFGISAAQARQIGLTIVPGLTGPFWIYCMFLVVLAMTCLWMAAPPLEGPGTPTSGPASPGRRHTPTLGIWASMPWVTRTARQPAAVPEPSNGPGA
jgi:hypothetical protein